MRAVDHGTSRGGARSVRPGLDSSTAGAGLFIAALFDSSLLSLPEVNDLLLIYFSATFPDNAYFYASMTVLGSLSGASGLYWLAWWKGHGYLQKRFPGGKIDRAFRLFERYGALAVAVPAILPPPFPFKIFVLSSGVLGLSYTRFFAAIVIGRSFRYFGTAYLAVRFGDVAIVYLRENAQFVFVAALVFVLVSVAWLVRRRWRAVENG